MKYFKLPDLGEGLQEAEIVEWHIKPGEEIKTDQLLVSVETAKAIVEVPSPQDGIIQTLFGGPGDILHVGEPLVEYQGETQEDTGTVVGEMKPITENLNTSDDHFIIGSAHHRSAPQKRCTPAVRALAKRLNVDLAMVSASGSSGLITTEDVEKAHQLTSEKGEQFILRGVQRVMANNMTRAHEQVVQVTIHDDVDIHLWPEGTEITIRIARAIKTACEIEPNLNAWYDGNEMTLRPLKKVDLGIAVDTPDGLFVPILRNIGQRDQGDLSDGLNNLRQAVKNRKIPPSELIGGSITLSNYGTIAGRYGNPVVVPPTVAIIGAGVIRDAVVAFEGEVTIHRVLPLSLSFDHRPITGGEAGRFLKAMMNDLALEN